MMSSGPGLGLDGAVDLEVMPRDLRASVTSAVDQFLGILPISPFSMVPSAVSVRVDGAPIF